MRRFLRWGRIAVEEAMQRLRMWQQVAAHPCDPAQLLAAVFGELVVHEEVDDVDTVDPNGPLTARSNPWAWQVFNDMHLLLNTDAPARIAERVGDCPRRLIYDVEIAPNSCKLDLHVVRAAVLAVLINGETTSSHVLHPAGVTFMMDEGHPDFPVPCMCAEVCSIYFEYMWLCGCMPRGPSKCSALHCTHVYLFNMLSHGQGR